MHTIVPREQYPDIVTVSVGLNAHYIVPAGQYPDVVAANVGLNAHCAALLLQQLLQPTQR